MPNPQGGIKTTHLINKVRQLGYSFHRQADRVVFYKKGVDRVPIPRRDFVPEDQARTILFQCGLTAAHVQAFIQAANA